MVDEIDTGLHYTVMKKMWQLVLATTRRLEVQVFATTHSLDCVRSLSTLSDSAVDEVAIHRIDRGVPKSTHYTIAEVASAIQGELEVR